MSKWTDLAFVGVLAGGALAAYKLLLEPIFNTSGWFKSLGEAEHAVIDPIGGAVGGAFTGLGNWLHSVIDPIGAALFGGGAAAAAESAPYVEPFKETLQTGATLEVTPAQEVVYTPSTNLEQLRQANRQYVQSYAASNEVAAEYVLQNTFQTPTGTYFVPGYGVKIEI